MSRCHRCGFICCICWMLIGCATKPAQRQSPLPMANSQGQMAEGRSQMAETANDNQSSQMLLPSLPRAARSSAGSEVEHVAGAVAPPVGAKPPGTVTLEWNAAVDGPVTGYRVYRTEAAQGTHDSYTTTATTLVITNLPAGTNVFYATAFDAAGIESAPSNTVEWFVPYASNRVERLVLEVYESLGGPLVGEFEWLTYTNTVTGDGQKFLRLRQELIGWEQAK